jgi:hypothetical protein
VYGVNGCAVPGIQDTQKQKKRRRYNGLTCLVQKYSFQGVNTNGSCAEKHNSFAENNNWQQADGDEFSIRKETGSAQPLLSELILRTKPENKIPFHSGGTTFHAHLPFLGAQCQPSLSDKTNANK